MIRFKFFKFGTRIGLLAICLFEKKKRERGNCGYRKRIKVKIKLVESFLKFGSCKTFL